MRTPGWTVVVVLLAACGSSAPSGTPSMNDDDPPILLPLPSSGYQIEMGPFSTPGQETQLCRTLKLDNDKPVAINRFELQMLAGSHHYILFRGRESADGTSQVEYPDNVFDCKGTINFDEWDFLLDMNKAGGDDWSLGAGQAIVLRPHAQLMIQSHFVNSTVIKSKGGYAVMNLHSVPLDTVRHKVQGMFTVDTRIAVPPHTLGWETQRRCSFSRTVNIVAMTGHFHEQGRTFTVKQMDANAGLDFADVYCSGPDCPDDIGQAHNWDSPLFKRFETPVLVNGSSAEGVHFTCSYDNYTDRTIYFGGLAATQEHCNLFFQYYMNDDLPGSLECEEGSGGW